MKRWASLGGLLLVLLPGAAAAQAQNRGALYAPNNLSDLPDPAEARVNLGAAASGVNGDITQLTNLNAPIEWEGSPFLGIIGSSSGWNTLIGVGAGAAKTANDDVDPGSDTFLGYQAGTLDNEPDGRNTYLGWQAGASMDSAIQETFVGEHAGYLVTGGGSSTLLGADAGRNATTVQTSVCEGWAACYFGSHDNDVAIGIQALYGASDYDASGNTVVGYQAGEVVSTGSNNVLLGTNAAAALTTGSANVMAGKTVADAATGATFDVILGANSATKITTASNDVIIGEGIASTTLTNGADDILIGTTSAVDTPAAGTNDYLNIGSAVIENLQVPTIGSGFGTAAAVSAGTSTTAFAVNIGTGGTASSGVIGMGTAAPHGWACSAVDQTNPASSNTIAVPTSASAIMLENYSRTTGAAAAWAPSDVVVVGPCDAY